jgi:hypothetical protein
MVRSASDLLCRREVGFCQSVEIFLALIGFRGGRPEGADGRDGWMRIDPLASVGAAGRPPLGGPVGMSGV